MKEAQDTKDAIELDKFVLLEEYLEGEEASILVMMDESGMLCCPSQDQKGHWMETSAQTRAEWVLTRRHLLPALSNC